MGSGSHVVLNGKPLTSRKNGSWAQGEVKPLRKRGLKVQSPILGTGVTENHTKMKKILFIGLFTRTEKKKWFFAECSLMFNRGSPPLFLTSSYSSPLVVVTDPLL